MRLMAMWLWLALGLAAAASAPAAPSRVEVVRDGDTWTADYRFGERAPAWLFAHSALTRVGQGSWRLPSWAIETPGVSLVRRGWYDVLVADDGGPVPAQVRVRFRPAADDLLADYDSALLFTGGAVALFSDQFDVVPLASAQGGAELPLDFGEAGLPSHATAATFRDRAGPILVKGERQPEATLTEGRTYVLFGEAAVAQTEHLASLIDTGLPAWLRDELSEFTPRMLAFYAGRLGENDGRPMLMVSWSGPSAGLRSMGGSVLAGLVLMTFEGEGVVSRDKEVGEAARWFVGHEAAHFWLGQQVGYAAARDAWITEGGADLLAIRASAALDPAFDAKAMLQQSLDDCVALAAGKPIATAAERNEHRAYYTCGAVFGLAAEAAAKKSDGDFFSFTRALIADNREDRIVTADEWLAALTRASGTPAPAGVIKAMVNAGTADAAAALARLFDVSGIAYARAPDGRLILS